MGAWPATQSLQQSAAYQELVRALDTPGCPVCAIAQTQARTHIGGILWDSVTDPDARARLDASLGLCGRHSREMLTFAGERLAIAIVQQAVIKAATRYLTIAPPPPRHTWRTRLATTWQRWRGNPDATPAQAVERTAPPASSADQPQMPAPCPACEVEARSEARVVEALVRQLQNDLDARLEQAGGLCRPHLYFALARSTPDQHQALIDLHQNLWSTLTDNLGEFIRKRDHRFHHEPITDAERDAVERSVQIITGGDPLYPPRKDSRR